MKAKQLQITRSMLIIGITSFLYISIYIIIFVHHGICAACHPVFASIVGLLSRIQVNINKSIQNCEYWSASPLECERLPLLVEWTSWVGMIIITITSVSNNWHLCYCSWKIMMDLGARPWHNVISHPNISHFRWQAAVLLVARIVPEIVMTLLQLPIQSWVKALADYQRNWLGDNDKL